MCIISNDIVFVKYFQGLPTFLDDLTIPWMTKIIEVNDWLTGWVGVLQCEFPKTLGSPTE